MGYRRFVAVGDSCTEGIDDPHPGGGGFRGWADLVAARLASDESELRYANLAVRGRRLDQIVAEQIPAAVNLRPDLVSVLGGANDVLQGHWDTDMVVANLDSAVRQLSEVARTVLLFTLPDFSGLLPGRRLRPRIEVLNDAARVIAERYGATLLDLSADEAARDPRYLGSDRLHLGPYGHQRLAAHVLGALRVPTVEDWLRPPPSPAMAPRWRRIHEDLRWVRHHVAPAAFGLVRNRVTGRQPGDGFMPKRPELLPVASLNAQSG